MRKRGCFRFGTVRLFGRNSRSLPRQIFGHHGSIELGDRTIGKTIPDLIHAEKWYAEIAPQRQPLSIGAHRHHGAADIAIAWLDDVAALVMQSLPLHVTDQGKAEQGRVPAVAGTIDAGRIGGVPGPPKHTRDS